MAPSWYSRIRISMHSRPSVVSVAGITLGVPVAALPLPATPPSPKPWTLTAYAL